MFTDDESWTTVTEHGKATRGRASQAGRLLLRESWRQMGEVRGIVALPIVGGLVAGFFFILFAGPGIAIAITSVPEDHTRTIVLTIAVLVGSVPATLAMTFFQGAIVSAALQQTRGEEASVNLALAGARKRFGRLMQWGLVVATVNVVLSLLRDRNNIFSSLLAAAGGLAWAAATYLALPVVIAEDAAPIAAVKRSAMLLKQTWGNALRVTVRFTVILLPVLLLTVLLIVGGFFAMAAIDEVAGVVILIIGVLVLIGGLAFASSLKAYITTQLYLYASGKPTIVSPELIRGAVTQAV